MVKKALLNMRCARLLTNWALIWTARQRPQAAGKSAAPQFAARWQASLTCCCWMYHDLAVHSVRFSCPRVFIVGHVDADAMESIIEAGVGLPGGDFIHGTHWLEAGFIELKNGFVISVADALNEMQAGWTLATGGKAGVGEAHFIELGLAGAKAGGCGITEWRGNASGFDEFFEGWLQQTTI